MYTCGGQTRRPTDPGGVTATVFVLSGATDDLARRIVLPAFFTLAARGLLPKDWRLIGNGRGDHPHEEFRDAVRSDLADNQDAPDPEEMSWQEMAPRILFAGGGFTEQDPGSLLTVLGDVRAELGDAQVIFYLTLPPYVFEPVTAALAAHGLVKDTRVAYEKPYGTTPEGFEQLDKAVHAVLEEEQVLRIEHFLGKEATQNLHVLRLANQMFAGTWHREHVAEVQIDLPETLDINDRAQFYERTGATLDMLVTHLFQVAAEVAMETPVSMSAADRQNTREDVIARYRPLTPDDVVLGQYEGYRDVKGVAPDSRTDTFVAARSWVDTDRWNGVPFVLRTGKRMASSAQQVTLVLRDVAGPLEGDRPPHGN
jgi:glucose-6-phosphate 1-dehydrogenase